MVPLRIRGAQAEGHQKKMMKRLPLIRISTSATLPNLNPVFIFDPYLNVLFHLRVVLSAPI